MIANLSQSNSLTDLAARIRLEHEATIAALKSSVEHAMAAGDLLIEAKKLVPHGQWLSWQRNHCELSARTIQLYMNLAKNRATIEKQIRNGVADLTLNEAAALCVLGGRIEKLLEFAKRTEVADPETLISICAAEGITAIVTENYDPLAGRSEVEKRDWALFGLFIGDCKGAHVEWLLQRPFQNVDEWLGPEGDKWRSRNGMPNQRPEFCKAWARFRVEYADKTRTDIEAEIRAAYEAAA
jgi:hypothetical protein